MRRVLSIMNMKEIMATLNCDESSHSENDRRRVTKEQLKRNLQKEYDPGCSGCAAPQCGDYNSTNKEPHPTDRIPHHRGWYSRGYLPHFDSPHIIQHITYRLADSLPREVLQRMREEVEASVQEDKKRQAALRQRIETFLDTGYGCCILRTPEVAACVVDTWHHFDGMRYRLLEWVVMPNHCHVLIEQFEGVSLGKIVLSWKNYTARFINRFMGSSEKSCSGESLSHESRVWQREYWDRYIRDERHFEAARNYIMMNPVEAGLAVKPEDWLWSSARERIDDGGKG